MTTIDLLHAYEKNYSIITVFIILLKNEPSSHTKMIQQTQSTLKEIAILIYLWVLNTNYCKYKRTLTLNLTWFTSINNVLVLVHKATILSEYVDP